MLAPAAAWPQGGPVPYSASELPPEINAIPVDQRQIIRVNAASFDQANWERLMQEVRANYALKPDGQLVAMRRPVLAAIPGKRGPAANKKYCTWSMETVRPYRYLDSTVVEVLGGNQYQLLEGNITLKLAPDAAPLQVGDNYRGWALAHHRPQPPNLQADEFAPPQYIYQPVGNAEPQVLDISNYLVKAGKIYTLAPIRKEICPVCVGMRRYMPNREEPTVMKPCPTCQETGKVDVQPLYEVFTGNTW